MAVVAKLVHTISSHTSDINGICFSQDELVTCSSDKTLRLWSLSDFTELPASPLCGHHYTVHSCALSPMDHTLASCSTDGKCILWNSKTGSKLFTLEHASRTSIRVCRFSPDAGCLATGGDDETICVWDMSSKVLTKTLEGHEASILAVAFSPDSAFLVSGSANGDLRVWDGKYAHGRHMAIELVAHDLGVTCCEFSPTYGSAGNVNSSTACQIHFLLVSGGNDNVVKLWDILAFSGSANVQLQLRDSLMGHKSPIMTCSFSPNGKLLASGAGDKTVRLWNPLKGEPVHVIEGHSRYVTSCAFSKDGNLLATGSNDKLVKIWQVTTEGELSGELTAEDILVDLQSSRSICKTVDQWTVQDVCNWLRELGMAEYEANFRRNAIDGTELLLLKDDNLLRSLEIDALGHRNKILRAISETQMNPRNRKKIDGNNVPDEFLCPITREVMMDPVIAADGYTYERSALSSWMKSGKMRSPMTNAVLPSNVLTPNRSLKMLIQRHIPDS